MTVGMLDGVLILAARMVYNTRMKLNTIICAAAVCGCVSFATAADEPAKTETPEPSKAELAEEEKGIVNYEIFRTFAGINQIYEVNNGNIFKIIR